MPVFQEFLKNRLFQSTLQQNGADFAPLSTQKPLMKMRGFFGLLLL
jgi:hypothetical protein